ncbi:SPX domain-containing protein, partial [Cantharellus anzutake]|uniref:SPX domain-containing protein n=1 Tax=Cantharellus anzutake TaxID=1750568 RepID=UPI00190527D4
MPINESIEHPFAANRPHMRTNQHFVSIPFSAGSTTSSTQTDPDSAIFSPPASPNGAFLRLPSLAISSNWIQEEKTDDETDTNFLPSPIDLPSPIIQDPIGEGGQFPARGHSFFSFPNPKIGTNEKRFPLDRTGLPPMTPLGWPYSVAPDATLSEIMATIVPGSPEARFFDVLDEELRKVNMFFKVHEREAIVHAAVLQRQLKGLKDHRRLFHEKFPVAHSPWIVPTDFRGTVGQLLPPYNLQRDNALKGHRGKFTKQFKKPNEEKLPMDPDDYVRNKRKLKKAVLEQYRGLELLNNYRILNLTGFRKVLKKFETVTKIPVQKHTWRKGLVDKCTFAGDSRILAILKEVEDAFPKCFAVLQGLHLSFQSETRNAIPEWEDLLQAYGALFILVLFPLLISSNIFVWTRFRINYAFIFELDMRSTINPRKYPEVPAFLFLTLSYSFWLSFARFGAVLPNTWLLDRLDIGLYENAGDCCCLGTGALIFLARRPGRQSHLYAWVVGCHIFCLDSQAGGSNISGIAHQWGLTFALSAFPFAIRFMHCIRRYVDNLSLHLIN